MTIPTFIKKLFSKKTEEEQFADRVLARYRKGEPTSDFAKSLFENETRESLNERFRQAGWGK